MPVTVTLERWGGNAQTFNRPVVCPAGMRENPEDIPGVECRIEDSVIDAAHDPSTLAHFCMGDYKRCSSWRADKHHHWARRLISMRGFTRPGNTAVDRAARG